MGLLLILQTSDETSAAEWERSADKWRWVKTNERQVQMSEEEWEASADEWDKNENASPFARWFQMLESLHIAEHAYWFDV